MRKAITILLALSMVLSLMACGGGAQTTPTPEPTQAPTATPEPTPTPNPAPTDEELKKAAEYIKTAEEYIIYAAAEQLDGWTKYADIMNFYFDDNDYMNADEPSIERRAKRIHEYRSTASDNMSKAKQLIGTVGDSPFYTAVKDYYKTVNKLLSLISTFPEGYSKVTFSNAVVDYQSECKSAYEEVAFYE